MRGGSNGLRGHYEARLEGAAALQRKAAAARCCSAGRRRRGARDLAVEKVTRCSLSGEPLPASSSVVEGERRAADGSVLYRFGDEGATRGRFQVAEPSSRRSSLSERGVHFVTEGAFYRRESAESRDLAVLAAILLKQRTGGELEVLDVMAGSGVRGARYLQQAGATHVHCNDLSEAVGESMHANLAAAASAAAAGSAEASAGAATAAWTTTHRDARRLLAELAVERRRFDVVDIDSFGAKQGAAVCAAALPVCKVGGLLYLTSTDGLSLSGRRPEDALANYGALTAPSPSSNEQGLRVLAGAALMEAAKRGLTVVPMFSLFAHHGPVYRVMCRVERFRGSRAALLENLGFVGYCRCCGGYGHASYAAFARGASARCPHCAGAGGAGAAPLPTDWTVAGPMWLGPLHDADAMAEMTELAERMGWLHAPDPGPGSSASGAGAGGGGGMSAQWRQNLGLAGTLTILRAEAEAALPPYFYNLDEVARAGQLPGTPKKRALADALQARGYLTAATHLESKAIRTDAPIAAVVECARSVLPQ